MSGQSRGGPIEVVNGLRLRFGYSITDIALICDVSRQTIYDWLSDEVSPYTATESRILRLKEVLNILDTLDYRSIDKNRLKCILSKNTLDINEIQCITQSKVTSITSQSFGPAKNKVQNTVGRRTTRR